MSSEFNDVRQDDQSKSGTEENPYVSITNATHEAESESIQDRRLHPISLMFSLIGQIKSNVIPTIFGLLGAANGNSFYIILACVFLIPSVALSIVRYFTVRYRIFNGDLVVNEGLIFRRTRTVPVERIQNIDLVQGVLHRIFKVAEVRVETASGTKPEAVLSVLSLGQVELLRRSVFRRPTDGEGAAVGTATNMNAGGFAREDANEACCETHFAPDAPADPSPDRAAFTQVQSSPVSQCLLKISTGSLAKAGFASDRGLIMVGVLLGVFFQFDSRAQQDYDFRFLSQWIPTISNPFVTAAIAIGVCLLGFLLLRVLGVGWYVMRFFGYQLRLSGEDFKISCGLLTKVSATVPRKRIQFISVHSNLVSRWLGLSSIRIETAGGAGTENENATATVSRRWFIPVIASADVAEMIGHLRPGVRWQPEGYHWQHLSDKSGTRMARIAAVTSSLLAPLGYAFFGIWGCSVSLIALPILVVYAIKKSRSVKFSRTSFGVAYRSGILTRKISLTFFEKIQSAAITQTPWDRRWQMATLSVDTAAAGPADHAIEIKYLDAEVARRQYDQILAASAGEPALIKPAI